MKDLVIIGGGPAGLTASIYSARKRVDFAMITVNIGGQALWGSDIQNYLGYTMVSGPELVKRFNEHVEQFDIEKFFEEVAEIKKIDDHFSVNTKNGRVFETRTVIFATGKRPRLLMVPGEKEFHGRGVTYCSTCDAPLFSGQPTLVVGGGNAGLEAALQSSDLGPKVYLVTSEDLTGDPITQKKVREKNNIEIIPYAMVKEIKGNMLVESAIVETSEGMNEYKVNGVLIEIGAVPSCSLVMDLVNLNDKMEIMVTCANETKTPGLFAAGDVTSVPEKQIIVAAGEGAKAALSAYTYLQQH